MRLALAALLFSACYIDSGDDGYVYEDGYYGSGSGWGSGWGGGSGVDTEYGCASDAECGGLVCARTRECLPASQVRAVHALWTVGGDAASATSCSLAPNLAITFSGGSGEQWGYAPVPCKAGKFTVDKFPTRFTNVQLARDTDYSGGAYGTFGSDGNALLDLPY